MPYAGLFDQPETDTRCSLRERLDNVLEACRPETISVMVETARIRGLRAGETIRPQGEPIPLSLIFDGHALERRTTADGGQLLCGIVPPGVLFGYSGIGVPSVISSVEMVALTDCFVAQWRGSEIRELVKSDVALGLAAIDSLSRSLHALVGTIEGFLHQDARRRVLRILARHRTLFFDDPPILTRAHLSGLVGTTQEMTRRVLRQLECEGTIAREGRSGLRLLRPERLEAPFA